MAPQVISPLPRPTGTGNQSDPTQSGDDAPWTRQRRATLADVPSRSRRRGPGAEVTAGLRVVAALVAFLGDFTTICSHAASQFGSGCANTRSSRETREVLHRY